MDETIPYVDSIFLNYVRKDMNLYKYPRFTNGNFVLKVQKIHGIHVICKNIVLLSVIFGK